MGPATLRRMPTTPPPWTARSGTERPSHSAGMACAVHSRLRRRNETTRFSRQPSRPPTRRPPPGIVGFQPAGPPKNPATADWDRRLPAGRIAAMPGAASFTNQRARASAGTPERRSFRSAPWDRRLPEGVVVLMPAEAALECSGLPEPRPRRLAAGIWPPNPAQQAAPDGGSTKVEHSGWAVATPSSSRPEPPRSPATAPSGSAGFQRPRASRAARGCWPRRGGRRPGRTAWPGVARRRRRP